MYLNVNINVLQTLRMFANCIKLLLLKNDFFFHFPWQGFFKKKNLLSSELIFNALKSFDLLN